MSTLNHLFDLSEQICYVQCGFCATILLVSVPCSSLSMVVTVRCGHCTGLLSVNMMKASFVPLHLLASFTQVEKREEVCLEDVEAQKPMDMSSPAICNSDCSEEAGDIISVNHIVNKPPEKRQRAPSAYNHFIREEIRRLKAENPNMPHKEAFSTAAKNWAHFPPFEYKGDGESCSHGEENVTRDSDLTVTAEVHEDGKVYRQRKVPRHSLNGQRHPLSE
ncbi:hypothetical protein FNV43_RR25970 [Rhamnella rubrinervis]|uniref:Axial regulator YABBY 4 n=1 Tax=Rhamnella rubrinervis TaxID=2594499 RepID=A0A8K0DHZ0_9ROSA|nr:hypothetical protein FNV43_RR25970 [Rhamnella rubrinervis]